VEREQALAMEELRPQGRNRESVQRRGRDVGLIEEFHGATDLVPDLIEEIESRVYEGGIHL